MYRRMRAKSGETALKTSTDTAELFSGETVRLFRTFIQIGLAITAISALAVFIPLAEAHEEVTRHHPHAAEARKPHEATSRHPHQAVSHPKAQKPPKHETALHAKAPKASKH